MPKKKNKNQAENENEGRPKELTLGDFLVVKTKSKQKDSTATPVLEQLGETSKSSLTTSSFSAVDGGSCEKPAEIASIDSDESKVNTPEYFVCRTKKGGFPIKVENRSSGKKVTLIEHVVGNGKVLVSELKSKFGTGGLFKDGVVELQGDFLKKLQQFFNENKQVLKPYGSVK